MRSDDELLQELGDALTPGPQAPSPRQVAALRAAVAERAAVGPVVSPLRPRGRRWWLVPTAAAATAAAVVAAFFAGGIVVDNDAPPSPAAEFSATLRSADGSATAAVSGTKVGIGRIVRLATDELPILPKGELYEVWFVGPGDTLERPNRISAGTFRPDAEGRSDVELTAAVDPTIYATMAVTAEPGDGNPNPSDVEVLRADVELGER